VAWLILIAGVTPPEDAIGAVPVTLVTGAVPLEAAVTRPLASTVMLVFVYEPADTVVFAKVRAVATLAEPSTEPEPVASPVKDSVLAVDQASAVVALPESDAVIVPALKSPLASLATTFEAVFADVASTAIVPLVVIVPPVRYEPAVTLVTVPVFDVLLLNVFQSVLDR